MANINPLGNNPPAPLPAQTLAAALVLSAKQLIDQTIPAVVVRFRGEASDSTQNNEWFFNPIEHCTNELNNYGLFLRLGTQLGGYTGNILPGAQQGLPMFAPVAEIPAIHELWNEPDTVRTAWHYILDPLNSVLHHKFQRLGFVNGIRCISEDEINLGRTIIDIDGYMPNKPLTGKIDVAWEVIGDGATRLSEKFFFLEFKRPGALDRESWSGQAPNEMNPFADPAAGFLDQSAVKISRQIIKYAYHTRKRFFALCDWDNLVLLCLPPNTFDRNNYLARTRRLNPNSPTINAEVAWFTNLQDYKRALWAAIDSAWVDRNT